jgi:hypothetical protein
LHEGQANPDGALRLAIYYQSCIVNVPKVPEKQGHSAYSSAQQFPPKCNGLHHERTAPTKSLNLREHLWRLDCVVMQREQAFLFR